MVLWVLKSYIIFVPTTIVDFIHKVPIFIDYFVLEYKGWKGQNVVWQNIF